MEENLRDAGVASVIVSGLCAEDCVLSTSRGAQDLDLIPIVFCEALVSDSLENIRFLESISDIVSYGVLKRLLE